MALQTGNLTSDERGVSTVFGLALSILALGRGNTLVRLLAGATGAALLARAAAGHCAVKAAVRGHSSLSEGAADQWRRMSRMGSAQRPAPGSPAHATESQAVDQSVDDSFPASDPPASRLPDEPPVNADAKWAAAKAADPDKPH